jgi:hypothetical protein
MILNSITATTMRRPKSDPVPKCGRPNRQRLDPLAGTRAATVARFALFLSSEAQPGSIDETTQIEAIENGSMDVAVVRKRRPSTLHGKRPQRPLAASNTSTTSSSDDLTSER